MKRDFDVAIVGSGFGGALLAMIAQRLGRSVVLLEKGRHPRFAIGESSTPLANLLLEELATRYDLPRLLPLAKWGSWQRAYPEIACGLKRGFTFYHHEFDRPFAARPDRSDQLLVAASPHDDIADTHWHRASFDHILVREAQSLGVEYLDEVALREVHPGDGVTLEGERGGKSISLRARFVVDATGPRGFLHRALHLPEAAFENLPPTQGLYTHFRGVRRLADGLIAADEAPYPVDDAAVHHVFDGGWIWVLRFNNGVTSAGVAAVDSLAAKLGFCEGEAAWRRLLQRLPTVAAQFDAAQAEFDFVHARRLSFRSGRVAGGSRVAGENWALLPSAAGFIDPLLSTGFPLTLLGVARLAEALEEEWGRAGFVERMQAYEMQTRDELLAAERLVAALYASMSNFQVFTALSLLYFAAASFAESARRLGQPQRAGGFLMHDHPLFGPQCQACCEWALRGLAPEESAQLVEQIYGAIAPFDVAGLCDRGRRNWHPVHAEDLLNAAGKLGVTREAVAQLLRRCGMIR